MPSPETNSAPLLSSNSRIRRTPFSPRVEAAGVTAYTVYNHTLLAAVFRSLEEDYTHLKSAVQVWDVSCERQVELNGPDAARLIQMTTPRDLARMGDDQCYYIPMVDPAGGMINDPVAIRLGPDRFWVSLSDSDMLYYFQGLAAGFGLNVAVFEPDVSPLAVQGPKADELIRRLYGDRVVATRFFRHTRIPVEGRDMVIARSGWSHQGGFEIYLDGGEHGLALWDALFEAGRDLDVRAGCPNGVERVEAGLLSYGSDMTADDTPFEAGLGKYCHLDAATGCLAREALAAKREPSRQIRALEIDGPALPRHVRAWPLESAEGAPAGAVRSCAWSPDFQTNVAIAMVDAAHWSPMTRLTVQTPAGPRSATVRERFWI